MARITKATLTQECGHLRRMLCLEIQTTSQLRREVEQLKAERVARVGNSSRSLPRPGTQAFSDERKAAIEYCERHGVKSVTRAQLLAERAA